MGRYGMTDALAQERQLHVNPPTGRTASVCGD